MRRPRAARAAPQGAGGGRDAGADGVPVRAPLRAGGALLHHRALHLVRRRVLAADLGLEIWFTVEAKRIPGLPERATASLQRIVRIIMFSCVRVAKKSSRSSQHKYDSILCLQLFRCEPCLGVYLHNVTS